MTANSSIRLTVNLNATNTTTGYAILTYENLRTKSHKPNFYFVKFHNFWLNYISCKV